MASVAYTNDNTDTFTDKGNTDKGNLSRGEECDIIHRMNHHKCANAGHILMTTESL